MNVVEVYITVEFATLPLRREVVQEEPSLHGEKQIVIGSLQLSSADGGFTEKAPLSVSFNALAIAQFICTEAALIKCSHLTSMSDGNCTLLIHRLRCVIQ